MAEDFNTKFLDRCELTGSRHLYHTIFTLKPNGDNQEEDDREFPSIDRIRRFCNEHCVPRTFRARAVEGETAIFSFHPKGKTDAYN